MFRPETYRSARLRLNWVRTLLILVALAAGLSVATAGRALALEDWGAGDGRRIGELAVGLGLVATLCWFGVYVASAIWTGRMYHNLFALGICELRFTPGWGVGAWFVPFLNLVRPKQIVDDIWRVTDPACPPSWAWRDRPASGVVLAWWGMTLAALVFAPRAGEEELADRSLVGAGLFGAGCMVVAAGFAWYVTSELTARLESFADRRAALLGWPTRSPAPATRRWATCGPLTTSVAALVGLSAGTGLGFGVAPASTVAAAVDEDVSPPASPEGRRTPIALLEVGDCLLDLRPTDVRDSGPTVMGAQVVACDVPHGSELIDLVIHDAPQGAEFPGPDALFLYGERCLDRFEEIVGTPFHSSALDVVTLTPTGTGWRFGDRTIQCLVGRLDGADLEETVVGSGL